MKAFLVIASLLSAIVVQAAPTTFKIQSELYIDGKLVASPRITTLAGEQASIEQSSDQNPLDRLKISVIPSNMSHEKMKDGIFMQFEVQVQSGEDKLQVSPQILAKSGSEAVITIGSTDDDHEIMMKVMATRE